MTPTARTDPPAADTAHGGSVRDRARERIASARRRFEGTWIGDFVAQLKALDVFGWTTIFGAELLWSVLPFLILLSSLDNDRIDDDLSDHIGLDRQGAAVLRTLFRNSPSHSFVSIATGLIVTFAGTIALVATLQLLYERVFEQEHRGWRNAPRNLVWLAALLGVLVLQGSVDHQVRRAIGPVLETLISLVALTIFFAWTMHFLLAGRTPWRIVIWPALVTALLWLGLAVFSALFLASSVVSDSREYGTIGVVFTLLTWFIAIGIVIVLGAAFGAVLLKRKFAGVTGGS